MTSTELPVEVTELRRNGMRLLPEEWPKPLVGHLRMHYWDGRRNSSRRTLRQLTLYGRWGTTERPVATLTDPQLIDVLGPAILLQGRILNSVDGRLYEHNQAWIVRPRTGNEPLPPFDPRPGRSGCRKSLGSRKTRRSASDGCASIPKRGPRDERRS